LSLCFRSEWRDTVAAMLIFQGTARCEAEAEAVGLPAADAELPALLEQAFGVPLTLLDAETVEVRHASPGQPYRDWGVRAEIVREVARRGRPELIDDEDPFLVLAMPLVDLAGNVLVAVATLVSRRVALSEDLSRPAEAVGLRPEEAGLWAARQTPWAADASKRVAAMVMAQADSRRRVRELEREARDLSVNLASTYEEISLLYRLTQNLKLSKSDEDLGRVALEWLAEVIPARGLAIGLRPVVGQQQGVDHDLRTQPVLLAHGECPIDETRFAALVEHLGRGDANGPVVVNPPRTDRDDWPCPQVRQVILVPLAEGENLFGHLAAMNHVDGQEFGTVEASLLSSVAAILGIHSGNIELYRQQSDLLAGIIRALSSAIDAKDPYTCGHSERVARVSVRIAEQLGADAKVLNTIYLSGLLHDIGKIGISDAVLRKPEKLSDEEYDHIKRHVEIGHHILRGLSKLGDVLPVVLHHHESWDGGGYPEHLGSEEIPLAARIVAVADAFDAMGSDRPYRRGMPDEKIDHILRAGAGKQWDPKVIDAFFQARDDIREIVRRVDRDAPAAPA
jgi:putative nucleotidyltransferase with HDIG domain